MTYNYYAKPFRSIVLFLFSLVLFGVCFAVLFQVATGSGEDITTTVAIVSAIGILFFGYGVYLMGKRIVDRLRKIPVLTIDRRGILDRTSAIVSNELISWESLSGFSYFEIKQGASKQQFIGLLFKDPAEIERILSPTKLTLNRQSQKMFGGGDYVFVSVSQVNAKPGSVMQAITEASNGTVQPLNVQL